MTTLYIHAVGAITGVGLDAPRCVASLRSGLDAFTLAPFWGEGEKDLQVAAVRSYAEGVLGIARYEALALRALVPALDGLSAQQRGQVTLFLGLPRPERPGVPAGLARELPLRLAAALGLARSQLHTVELGRASTIHALREALPLCERGQDCIVGGVDCLVNPHSLHGLSREGLLKEAWDGFIPGEGAAFVRLSRRSARGPFGHAAPRILGFGTALESADGTSDEPLVGVGVRRAFELATVSAGLTEADIELCINDVNGARTAFEDEAYGWIRFFRSSRPEGFLEVWHGASFAGELGAAAGALGLIWGAAALELGFHPARHVLLSTSDGKLRSAAVLAPGAHAGPERGPSFRVGLERAVIHPPEPSARASFDAPVGFTLKGERSMSADLLARNLAGVAALGATIKAHHEQGEAPWLDLLGFEDRLLAHLDALSWGGAEARGLALAALRSDAPDESAAGALSLLAVGPDEGFAECIVEAAQASAEHGAWICEFARHAAPEAASALLSRMLEADALRATALDALRAGQLLTHAHVERALALGAGACAAALVRALGWLAAPSSWERVQSLLSGQRDEETLMAALVVAPHARHVFDAAGVASFEAAPLAWTFAGFRPGQALALPWDEPGAFASPAALEALGFTGDPRTHAVLLSALGSEDVALVQAAARALRLLSGARLERDVLRADPDEPEGRPRLVTGLSSSPADWEPLLAPHAAHATRLGVRMDAGSASVTLRDPNLGHAVRRWAVWEHALRRRETPPLSPRMFVRVQRALLGV